MNVGPEVRAKLESVGVPAASWDMPAATDSPAAPTGNSVSPPSGQSNADYRDWPHLDPQSEVARLTRLCDRLEAEGRAKDLVDAINALRLAKLATRQAVIEERAEEQIAADQAWYCLRTVLAHPEFYGLRAAVGDIFDLICLGDPVTKQRLDPSPDLPMPADIEKELRNRVAWFEQRLESSRKRLAEYQAGTPFDSLSEEQPPGDPIRWNLVKPTHGLAKS